jgi:tetratricopeptide (TPR) repeat protein
LSHALGYLGEVEEAERLCSEAIDSLVSAYGENHPEVLYAIGARAVIFRQMGDNESAEALYRDLLEKQRQFLGPNHPEAARTLNNLAYLLKTEERYAESERYYREALDVLSHIHEQAHPNTIRVRQNLASVLYFESKYDEVENELREVVELQRELHPEGNSMIGSALIAGLGRFLMDRQKYAEAEPVLREGVAIYEKTLGYTNPEPWIARASLASCLFGLGRTAEAEGLAYDSLEALKRVEEFTRNPRYNIGRVASQFDKVGQTDLAASYRALIEN